MTSDPKQLDHESLGRKFVETAELLISLKREIQSRCKHIGRDALSASSESYVELFKQQWRTFLEIADDSDSAPAPVLERSLVPTAGLPDALPVVRMATSSHESGADSSAKLVVKLLGGQPERGRGQSR